MAIEKHKFQVEQGIRGNSVVTLIYEELRRQGYVMAEHPSEAADVARERTSDCSLDRGRRKGPTLS